MDKCLHIIPRKIAIERGMKRYFTGKPCKHGHVGERFSSSKGCLLCCRLIFSKTPGAIKSRKRYLEKNPYFQKQYYENNKKRLNRHNAEWKLKNVDKVRRYNKARKAMLRNPTSKYSHSDIHALLTHQRHKCASCRVSVKKTGYHVDHVIPLARGGTNWPDNLQILCPTCNMAKGAKDPIEWAQELGRLL